MTAAERDWTDKDAQCDRYIHTWIFPPGTKVKSVVFGRKKKKIDLGVSFTPRKASESQKYTDCESTTV